MTSLVILVILTALGQQALADDYYVHMNEAQKKYDLANSGLPDLRKMAGVDCPAIHKLLQLQGKIMDTTSEGMKHTGAAIDAISSPDGSGLANPITNAMMEKANKLSGQLNAVSTETTGLVSKAQSAQ